MKIDRKVLYAAVIALSFGSSSQLTLAQQLEEVIVTATKRTASAQEVPAAIEAYTDARLDDAGVSSLAGLNMISSGFKMNKGSGTNQIAIRGIGSFINGGNADGTTAVYVDDSFISRMYAFNSSVTTLDDVTSIQVLKGPQGTLYGRNATGGAVVIQTFTPNVGDELNGKLKATVGDFGVQNISGRIGSGFGDNFAASFSFGLTESDGFIDCHNCPGYNLDEDDSEAYKLKVAWEPTDSMSFLFTGSYAETEAYLSTYQQVGQNDSFAAGSLGLPDFGLNNPQTGWFAFALQSLLAVPGVAVDFPTLIGMASGLTFTDGAHDGAYSNGINDTSYNAGVNPLISDQITIDNARGTNVENESYSLKATFEFENFDLVSVTGYSEFRSAQHGDVLNANPASLPDLTVFSPEPDNPANPITATLALFNSAQIGFSGFANSDAFTQEISLASTTSDIEWITGIFYFNEDLTINISNDAFGLHSVNTFNDMEVESVAAYAEATFPITDDLSFTGGVRYTDESNELEDKIGTLDPSIVTPGTVDQGDIDLEDDQWTYNARLNYQFDESLLYAGISTGFKSAVINAGAPSTGTADAEEITAYEIGLKSDFLDGQLRLNGAAFYYDYENLQLSIIDPSGASVVANGADAEVLGLEIDLQWLVGANTTIFGNATVLDHELTDNPVTNDGTTQIVEGNSIPMVSDYVVVAGVNHLIPTNIGTFGMNLNVNHNSGYFIDQLNTFGSASDGDDDGSYTLTNASISYSSPDEAWDVRVYVNNIFDEEYFQGGTEVFGSVFQIATAGRERHYGVTVAYSF